MPAYDQRTYSGIVKALRDEVKGTTAQFAPPKRFQFKQRSGDGPGASTKPDTRRLNPAATLAKASPDNGGASSSSSQQPSDAKDTVGSLPSFNNTATAATTASKNYNAEIARPGSNGIGIRKPSFSTARDIDLSDHSRVHITLPASASRATSAGTLTNLDRCVVDMSVPTAAPGGGAPFASLALRDIAGCAIAAGHVDGPVHVTRVRDSAVLVAARQVRIHDCENVVFYLRCVSRPIIENCKNVRFAKAPEAYVSCPPLKVIHPLRFVMWKVG